MPVRFTAYQKMQRLPDFPVEDLSERLEDSDTFVWLTLTDPMEAELLQIQEEFGLHELASAEISYQELHIICRSKSNIGPDEGGFRYDLKQLELDDHPDIAASKVVWGRPMDGTAREI